MRESKRLMRTFDGLSNDRPPFWFMRQAGRYLPEYRAVREQAGGFLEMCFSPDMAAEVTLQPIRRFDMDAAILFCDILVVPYALGIPVSFVKGEGPKLEALDTREKLFSLQPRDVLPTLAPCYEAASKVSAALPKDKVLIGFCGAPWTVATYIVEGGSSRDFAKTQALALQHPDAFSHLMEVLVDASVAHLVAQVDAGAEVVQIFDSWAGILPDGAFERWAIEPIQMLMDKFKAICPGVPVIGFPKGAGLRYASYSLETGVDAITADQTVPLDALSMLGEISIVQGNLDPLLVAYDKQGAVDMTKRILEAMRDKPFIFNLGHGFIPQTPIENVEAVSHVIRNWR